MADHIAVLTELQSAVEYRYPAEADAGLLVAVAITFAEGVWTIEVDPDTDEVDMRLSQPESLRYWPEAEGRDVSDQNPWLALLGTSSVWRWQLTNQQGYADGVQIELTRDDRSCVTMQWIAAASRLLPAVVHER